MRIQLSEHFDFKKLARFILPTVVMMVFTSVYSVVDGLFVSNFVGKTAFAAVNLIMPIVLGFGAVGLMFGTGGSALVAKVLGEGDKERANAYFTMLVVALSVIGVLLTAIGLLILRPVASALGAEGQMLEDCVIYGQILIGTQVLYMLEFMFQSFFSAAEKPKLGLFIIILAGVTNIVLDALFIVVFRWGLVGAAVATAIGQAVGAVIPLVYFIRRNNSLLRLVKTKFSFAPVRKACVNGASEMMSNLSASVVNILYNFQLMKLIGENGVAAYGFIMYVSFFFSAIFLGYSIGAAPIISYNYGADNRTELKSIYRKSMIIIGAASIAMTVSAIALSSPLSSLFVGYDAELFELTRHGFVLYSFSFLLMGVNIFGSGFFTALNNGVISAAISFLRTLVFQIAAVMVLPLFLNIDGIWLSVVVAESLSFIVTSAFLLSRKKRYGYM